MICIFDVLDIAIDGADQISPEGWLIKGGGGAKSLALRLSDLPITHSRLGLLPIS